MSDLTIDVAIKLTHGAERYATLITEMLTEVDAEIEASSRDAATVAAVISATAATITLITELIKLRNALKERKAEGKVLVENFDGAEIDLLDATDEDIRQLISGEK